MVSFSCRGGSRCVAVATLPLFLALIEAGILAVVLILVFVAFYRITAKEVGTSMERSELKSILGSVEDALVVYGTDFHITFFNPAAERLFKIQAKDAMGHIFSPQDVEEKDGKFSRRLFSRRSRRVSSCGRGRMRCLRLLIFRSLTRSSNSG